MTETWTRPFRWGVILLSDEDATEIPDDIGTTTVAMARSTLSIGVKDAHDTEIPEDFDDDDLAPVAEVTVTAHNSASAPADAQFDCRIATPSRRVTIGDAEEERTFKVTSDATRVQIHLDPPEEAQHVSIWLTEAD
jgi:hypothetical protein